MGVSASLSMPRHAALGDWWIKGVVVDMRSNLGGQASYDIMFGKKKNYVECHISPQICTKRCGFYIQINESLS